MYVHLYNRVSHGTVSPRVKEEAIMAKVRIIEYEGSDEEILKLLTQHTSPVHSISSGVANGERNGDSTDLSVWESVAKKFQKYVSDTAAWGRESQNKAMLAWLEHNGEIDLATLWKASGVKAQHDFGGVGGSLSKNMKKAGGPREWYSARRNGKGRWIYKIVDELVEPLKSAFGLATRAG
jgi:hypothetical protein